MKHKRMRQLLAGTLAIMLTIPVALGLSVPLKTQAAASVGVQYRYDGQGTDSKNRVGIRSVVIDGKTYFDIHDGSPTGRTDPTAQLTFLQSVLQSGKGMSVGSDSIIGQWASLAEQIYGTHNKYSARVNASGGFQKNFTGESNRERKGYAQLSYALAQTEGKTVGSPKGDYTKWTGLSCATNLKSVRQQAADEIARAINRKVKGDEVLSNAENGNALKQLDDETNQDVLFSLVTCVDRAGGTFKYNYNTFGIAFYDFQLSVLAGEGLEYITKAQKYDSLEAASNANVPDVTYKTSGRNKPVVSYYKNESKQEADVGMEFTQSNSLTTSNTLETGQSYSYSEMVGSETMFKATVPLFGGIEETLKMEVTCEQALSTAYSETKEYSETSENKVSANMTLPAQTAVGMESSNAVTNVKLGYDCPVAITYKVAIFSLSGEVYDDGAATKHFGTAGYRQSHFCTIFGSSSDKGGTTAMDNLYNRAVRYTATANYEQSYGQTVGWTDKHGDGGAASKLNGLDWKGILDGTISEEEVATETADITVKRVLVDETGKVQSILGSSALGTKYPVAYESLVTTSPNHEITTGETKKNYKIYTGAVKDSSGNEVENEIEYDSVSDRYQKWVQPIGQEEKQSLIAAGVSQADVNAINSVTFYYTEVTGTSGTASQKAQQGEKSVSQSAKTAQRAAANGNATLKDKVAWLATKCPMSVTGGVISYDAKSMNSNINGIVPLYPLKNITVTNGVKTLNMISGDTFDLSTVTLNGTNSNDVDYYGFDQEKGHWILTDVNGHEVIDSKKASIEKNDETDEEILTAGEEEGTLYLKYVIDEDVYTSLDCADPSTNASLTSTAKIKVNVTGKPFDGSVYAEGTTTTYVGEEPVNLIGNEEIKGYALDATDKKISGAPIVWESRLDEEDGIKLDNNKVSFTKSGSFQIRATYHGKHSDWITVKVLPKKALSTLKISDETKPATLESFIYKDKDTLGVIDLSKLKVEAFDQYDGEWKDTSNVKWRVEREDGTYDYLEGTELPIEEAGTYKIQAVSTADNVESNVLTLEVKPQRKIAKLEISDDTDPKTLAGFVYKDKGTPLEINLSNLTLKATDQYDEKYADTSKVTWSVDVDGENVDDAKLLEKKLPINKAGIYTIRAKYGDNVISNALTLEVKAQRVLKSLEIKTNLKDKGLGIGKAYTYDLKKNVEVTALDQYNAPYDDWTKEKYQWITGGRYSKVTRDTLEGLVNGSDTLQLVAGEGETKVESNRVDFDIVTKPYVKELYTGDSAVVREGEGYDLSKVDFTAKDQNGDLYELSAAEIDSIQWELTDKGTIKGNQASFDAQSKTLSVPEGTLGYGETGSVILKGTFKNRNEKEAQAVQFTLNVRQKPVLNTLKLEKQEEKADLKNGENAYVDEYFTVKGFDQYEESYALDSVALSWNSDNEDAFRFENNKIMAAVKAGKKANITVSAVNVLKTVVVSNSVALQVPRVRSLTKITLEDVPEVIAWNSTLDMNTLTAICYDELGEAYSEEELKNYPAKISYSFDAQGTDCKLDTAKNILRTGNKYGYITISAMAVNSSTTNTVQDEDGNDIISSVKVWVGPKAESLKATEKMIATAGKNAVILEGKCLENGMKIGLFDASGKLIDEKVTSGDSSEQKVTLDVPSNIGGKSDVTYTVKYAITDTYMDEPAAKIVVSNKIPATGVTLNKNSLVISPNKTEKLLAAVSPENSTDKLSWKSSQSGASVDQNGNVKALAPGRTVITVTTESGRSASCNVLVGLRKGDVIASGIYRYKVTDAMVDGTGKMEVIGFVKGRSKKNVSIPKSVAWNTIKYNVTSVGTRAFARNKKIRSIVIPDSVETIRHKAFYACPNVKKLTIGKNVSFIGAHAFCLNKKLEKIVFRGTKLKQLRKPHVFIEVKHAKVYVPKRKYKAYKKMLSDYGLDRCKFVKK